MRASLLAVLLVAPSCVAIDRSFTTRPVPQRPFFARNAYTTAPQTLELESGVLVDPGDSFDLPILIKHGLDERSELSLGIDPIRTIDLPGGGSTTGLGDTVLAYKRRVLEQDGEQPAAAFELSTKLPTASGDRGLGSGEIDLFAAGAATWGYEDWTANGYYRMGLLGARGRDGQDVQHLLSASGTHLLIDRLHGLAELALLWTPSVNDEQVIADVGLRYECAPGVALDGAVYVGLTSDAPSFAFALGFTTNLGRQGWRLPE